MAQDRQKQSQGQSASKQEAQYEPPASQVDLKARLESGNASAAILSTSDEYARRQAELDPDEGRSMVVEGNEVDNYVATDVIYMNYANETEKPLKAEGDDNPEAQLEGLNFGQVPRHSWEVNENLKTGESDSNSSASSVEEPSKPELPKSNES